MKKIRRVLFLLIAVMILFSGCKFGNADPPETTEVIVKNDEDLGFYIIQNGITDYKIVYPKNSSSELTSAINSFKKAVKEATGVSLVSVNDFKKEDSNAVGQAKEILIGATNRKASIEKNVALRSKDYSISQSGNQLVIVGGSDEAVRVALEKLVERCLPEKKMTNMSLNSDDFITYTATYTIDSLMLNDKDISEYRIVFPEGNVYLKKSADTLRKLISEKVGVNISVVSDATENQNDQPELLLGDVNRGGADSVSPNQAKIVQVNQSLQILGGNVYDTLRGINAFQDEFLNQTGTVEWNCLDKKEFSLPNQNPITTMSFNILYTIKDSTGSSRAPKTAEAILSAMPDTVGVQECTVDWKNSLDQILGEHGYSSVGELNHATQKWYNAIFYRTDRLKLIETKTMWLSDTPDISSKFADSNQYRTVTYAVFEDLQTGERFAHYNTHLDIVIEAAEKQLKVLQNMTSACEYPFVVTGDFNILTIWPQYQKMQETWIDSAKVADVNEDSRDSIMDFCMINEGIVASKFVAITDPYVLKNEWDAGNTNGQSTYISDHWPCYIQFYLYDYNK